MKRPGRLEAWGWQGGKLRSLGLASEWEEMASCLLSLEGVMRTGAELEDDRPRAEMALKLEGLGRRVRSMLGEWGEAERKLPNSKLETPWAAQGSSLLPLLHLAGREVFEQDPSRGVPSTLSSATSKQIKDSCTGLHYDDSSPSSPLHPNDAAHLLRLGLDFWDQSPRVQRLSSNLGFEQRVPPLVEE